MLRRSSNLMFRFPAVLLAIACAFLLETFFTIEWSFPKCSQTDWPAPAVFGMPFPYIAWTTVSSMEYGMMPHVYVIDIACLALLIWPFTALLVGAIAPPGRDRTRVWIASAGLVLSALMVGRIAMLVGIGMWRPTLNTVAGVYTRYRDLRPMRFTANDLHYDCTPSPDWFPAAKGTRETHGKAGSNAR